MLEFVIYFFLFHCFSDTQLGKRSCSELSSPVNDVHQWVLSTNSPVNDNAKKKGAMSLLQEQVMKLIM